MTTWVWCLVAGWIGFILGFLVAALMAAARDDRELREHNLEAMRSAGLNDD